MLEATMAAEDKALRFYRDVVNEDVAREDAARAERGQSWLAPEGMYGAQLVSYEPADPEKLFEAEKASGARFYMTTWSVSGEAGEYEIRFVKLTPDKWKNERGWEDKTYINARNLFLHGDQEDFVTLLEWARHNTVPCKVTVGGGEKKRNYLTIYKPKK